MERFYFNDLKGKNQDLRNVNSTRVLRNHSWKLARKMNKDAGGDDYDIYTFAPPKILYQEYMRLLGEKSRLAFG